MLSSVSSARPVVLSCLKMIGGVLMSFAASSTVQSAETASAPRFSIDQVDSRYLEWADDYQVRLAEYNTDRKPILRSTRKDLSCRAGDRGTWKVLPQELSFPEPLALEPKLRIECRSPRGALPTLVVHFDVGVGIDSFAVEGQSILGVDILTTPTGQLLRLGPKGEVKFYRRVAGAAEDFKPHRVNGKTFYSYMLNAVHSPGVSTAGYRTILNSRYEVVEALDFLTDLHEFEYLGPKHYLYMSYDVKDRADGSCMIDQSVVESKDGHILNRFDVSEYLQSGHSLGPKSKVAFRGRECDDVAHINGVQVIGASTWLISLGRGTIVSWDRDKKKPLWIFGQYESQFKIDPYVALRQTHTPRFFADESRLVVFENGEPPTDVRIIDFKLDIKSKRIVASKVLTVVGLQSIHSGSVEARRSVYSIGAGSREKGEWDFLEYDGVRRTFAIRFSKASRSYRVYRSL